MKSVLSVGINRLTVDSKAGVNVVFCKKFLEFFSFYRI